MYNQLYNSTINLLHFMAIIPEIITNVFQSLQREVEL